MNNFKLGVEVTAVHGLEAKDGEGSSNTYYVELRFDDQRFHMSTKEKDPDPVWNETFYFNLSDRNNVSNLVLEASVYSYKQSIQSKSFCGKVCINGSSFVPYSDASEVYFPLEKRNIFSRVKGKLGLKVFITDDPSVRPVMGGRVILSNNRPVSKYDLVEPMIFLFVCVVKARDLPNKYFKRSLDPYVEVKNGNYRGITLCYENKKDPEWNEVFAFVRDRLQGSRLEVRVKNKDEIMDGFVGIVWFDLNDVPTRVPPDSTLPSQWYLLEDEKGEKIPNGELMLAVWYGTQVDEAFSDAWHSDAMIPDVSAGSVSTLIRSKVYHSPRLWYLRVNIIEAQDLIVSDKGRFPDCFVKVQHGAQMWKTKPVQSRMGNPLWNEEWLFVAAEPFDEQLCITVEE